MENKLEATVILGLYGGLCFRDYFRTNEGLGLGFKVQGLGIRFGVAVFRVLGVRGLGYGIWGSTFKV